MKKFSIVVGLVLSIGMFSGCDKFNSSPPMSTSGVQKISVHVKTNAEGITVEQSNVRKRLTMDNTPGSIKFLYVISAFSGDVLIYSSVKGKVTSSGKRLTPTTVLAANGNGSAGTKGIRVNIGGKSLRTSEVLQDDGTYGHSIPYIYWFDQRGAYHQHYVSGGQIIHVSSVPLNVGRVIINMELAKK